MELKELQTTEVELTTQSDELSSIVAASRKQLSELERGNKGAQTEAVLATAKSDRLKAKLSYLQSVSKALNEQNAAMVAELVAYKNKYLSK